jgi:hypothetical protein
MSLRFNLGVKTMSKYAQHPRFNRGELMADVCGPAHVRGILLVDSRTYVRFLSFLTYGAKPAK